MVTFHKYSISTFLVNLQSVLQKEKIIEKNTLK